MLYYKTMDKWLMCVVALILGMLLANMLKSVCGCKTVVEGARDFKNVGELCMSSTDCQTGNCVGNIHVTMGKCSSKPHTTK